MRQCRLGERIQGVMGVAPRLYVVERGHETGMKHVHAVQWGQRRSPAGARRFMALRLNSRFRQLEPLPTTWVRASSDTWESIDGDPDSIEAHMNLNGGRAAHWSRPSSLDLSRDAYRRNAHVAGNLLVQICPSVLDLALRKEGW